MRNITLSDGNAIPCMGFGCYNGFGDEMVRAVSTALEEGYSYIDSAEAYKNEELVGEGLRPHLARREELFILSKAWPTSFADLESACTASLKKLGTDYLDGYLLHWPWLDEALRLKAYEQLLKLQEKGLVRTIGVSNFLTSQMEKIKEEFGAWPTLYEIECHPSYQQRAFIDWCRERDIQTIAYSPINRSADLGAPVLQELAEKYGKTPGQIVLNWHIAHDQIPIPKSVHADRIRENIQVFDFALTPEEMALIDALEAGKKSGQDPLVFPSL